MPQNKLDNFLSKFAEKSSIDDANYLRNNIQEDARDENLRIISPTVLSELERRGVLTAFYEVSRELNIEWTHVAQIEI